MLEVLKKYKYQIIKFAIMFFLGSLFVVQLPYWLGDIKVLIQTDFEASDILGFLGDYISAFGTIVLGWIAIKQTDKANSISDRVAELELAKHEETHRPVILIDWVKLHDSSYNDIACNVGFGGQINYIDGKFEQGINEERQCIEINLINTGQSSA